MKLTVICFNQSFWFSCNLGCLILISTQNIIFVSFYLGVFTLLVNRGPLSFTVSQAIVEEGDPANAKWHE